MKVVVFTADEANGGVKQLVLSITRTCARLGYETYVLFPKDKNIDIDSDVRKHVIWYEKAKSLNPYNEKAKKAARLVNEICPDVVIMPEDSIFSMQVMAFLSNKIKKGFIIHDVNPHPSNMGLRKRITHYVSTAMRRIGLNTTDKVVLLSKNSYNRFLNRYPNIKEKALIYTLGAHIPYTGGFINKPIELSEDYRKGFALFFGRIDKYKGVDRLVRTFKEITENKTEEIPLIIAGKGILDDISKEIILKGESILLLNRFINDAEMIWLFKNCKFVVLPYTEASQSGILPIAYAFGKPVIASNIQGLCENVDHGKTGLLVNNDAELKDALSMYLKGDLSEEAGCCLKYSNEKYNWEKNTQVLIEEIMR